MRKMCFVIMLIFIFLVGCTNEKVKPTPSPIPTPTTAPVTDQENNQPQVEQDPVEQVEPAIDTSKLGNVFGFAGVKGQQILVTGLGTGQEDLMSPLNKAIGANGEVVPIIYSKYQAGNEELNNGRDLSINMANMPGYLFTVEEGSAQEDQTYYLINGTQFDTGALLTIQVKNESVSDEQLLSEFQAIHDRKIEQAWTLAQIEDTDVLYLVHFATVGEEHLFSLVLKRGDKFIVKDYPETQKETTSVWRVDDGGEISADNFSMLFAANTSEGILLSLNWWGFEGVNSMFLLEQNHMLKELDTRYGRYTFPI